MDVFAGVSVTDRSVAIDWYDRLLGEVPTFEPNEAEWVWSVSDHSHVYVLVDPQRAGSAHLTLFVDDLSAVLEIAARRGVEPTTVETYPNGVRKAIFHDPDGNEVGLGGAPSGS